MILKRRKTISNTRTAGARPIAQRTCLACRRIKDKGTLLRLVRTPDGVEIDRSGKKTGRGAYLCPVRACWESGLKGDRLAHALRGSLTGDNREQLLKSAEDLLKGDK